MNEQTLTANKLPFSYYQQEDVVFIARNLLGKILCTNINGKLCKGIIVETEAYSGENDKSCHAHLGRHTERTKVMYEGGGLCYVYISYGLHYLLNVVTNKKGRADCVLIRGIEPIEGIEWMQERRKMTTAGKELSAGPGRLTQALGINKSHYGTNLLDDLIWIEDSPPLQDDSIVISTRIGIESAGEDAFLPWRFYIKGNKYVSKY